MAGLIRDLLKEAYRLRGGLIVVVAACAAAGALAGRMLPYYEVRNLLRFQAVSADSYRQASFILSETSAISQYFKVVDADASYAKPFVQPTGSHAELVQRFVSQVWPPVRPGGLPGAAVDANQRINVGLVIASSGRDISLLQQQVDGIRRCIGDTLLRTSMIEQYRESQRKFESDVVKLLASINGLREERRSVGNRIVALRDLATKYPDSAKFDSRQIVEVRGEAARYLPLQQQIVAAESAMVDIEEQIRRSELTLEQHFILIDYYKSALQKVETNLTWGAQHNALEQLRSTLFTAERLKNPLIADALRSVVDHEQQIAHVHIPLTTDAEIVRRFGAVSGGLGGTVLGLLLALLMLALPVLWRRTASELANG